MVEKEIKILLDKKQYDDLLVRFDFEYSIDQKNYYYRCDNMHEDMTIRIREIDDELKLQIKIPQSRDKALHIKNEFEEKIYGLSKIIAKEKLSEVAGFSFECDAKYIGYLITNRLICNSYNGAEICLDKNSYLDVVDYELEIEFVDDSYLNEIIDRIEELGIKVNSNVDGKNTRFCKRLMEVNNS